jgi:dATP/dGTP diphosphohydrolase, N-terminal
MADEKVKRVPVDYIYTALNPDFLKALARIAKYAEEKYGSWSQYTAARLEGDKSCINHIYEHLRQYQLGEPHDKFGDLKMQLAAVAYNAMMEWHYLEKFGPVAHPLLVREPPLPAYLVSSISALSEAIKEKAGSARGEQHASEEEVTGGETATK